MRSYFETYFQPYRVVNGDGSDSGLITGYYEPILHGSRTRQGPTGRAVPQAAAMERPRAAGARRTAAEPGAARPGAGLGGRPGRGCLPADPGSGRIRRPTAR